MTRYSRSLLPLLLLAPLSAFGQAQSSYAVPRTDFGHPDISGNWHVRFTTTLERPENVESLVVSEERAREIAAELLGEIPHNEDPDFSWQNVLDLAMVNGEYRTSIIVDPPDGKLPYLESSMPLVEYQISRYETQFDHPEQRPPGERCLESFAGPPIYTIPLMIPFQFVQTEDQLLLQGEYFPGFRLIHLNSQRDRREVPPSQYGYSTAQWEGDTLVIETGNFLTDHPIRSGFGRPLIVSENTRISERFTRLSDNELHYYFTVDDSTLYSQAFSGEFSLFSHEGPVYEYACHEGNYSLPGVLRGGQLQN